jgi:hypothetical protein
MKKADPLTLEQMQATRIWVKDAADLKHILSKGNVNICSDAEDVLPSFFYESYPEPDGTHNYDLYIQFDMEHGQYGADLWGAYKCGTNLQKLEAALHKGMMENGYGIF